MNRKTLFFATYVVALAVLSGSSVFPQTQPAPEEPIPGEQQLAVDLYRALTTTHGNLIFSPYGIRMLLTLTYEGARGETSRQLANALHIPDGERAVRTNIASSMKRLIDLNGKDEMHVDIANAILPQVGYPFLPEYMHIVRDVFNADVFPVDYQNNARAVPGLLNSWADKMTEHRISNIMTDAPSRLTRLIIENAIYFKGKWLWEFPKDATTQLPFYVKSDKAVEVPMMHVVCNSRYREEEYGQLLELPYLGNELSMVVLLPRERFGLAAIESQMNARQLERQLAGLRTTTVEVLLPRFGINSSLDLQSVLESIGVTDLFKPYVADLSGMDGRPRWLFAGEAKQDAFVEVNEEGTEAAAVTHGGGCFPAGTEVLTTAGLKPIEEVKAGTRVLTYDLDGRKWRQARVTKRLSREYTGDMITITAGPVKLTATGNHPFFVSRGEHLGYRRRPADLPAAEEQSTSFGTWVEARDLHVGDVLVGRSEGQVVVTATTTTQAETAVYNLAIEGFHNYAVSVAGILVHNKASSEHAPPPRFRADHPFIFMIRDVRTGSILFLGRLSDPGRQPDGKQSTRG